MITVMKKHVAQCLLICFLIGISFIKLWLHRQYLLVGELIVGYGVIMDLLTRTEI